MKQRDIQVDILRGLAIFTMIAANMAAHSLAEPHSFVFRLYGSIAAPLFVFLSGMMVSYTSQQKSHKIPYYLKRAGAVLLIAALIDLLLWEIVPFCTFDVLYIIAIAMPIVYYFNKIGTAVQILLIVICFVMGPLLQDIYGYSDYPVEVYYAEAGWSQELVKVPFWQQLLIDGWFPVFPWLGVSLLGALIGKLKVKLQKAQFDKILFYSGLIMLTTGIVFWLLQKPDLITREGYSELFYPPTTGYFLSFSGGVLLLMRLLYTRDQWNMLNFLTVYGQSSLLVYILHTVFIVYIFSLLDSYRLVPFLGLYLLHATVLWLICFGIKQFTKQKKLPFLVRLITGG